MCLTAPRKAERVKRMSAAPERSAILGIGSAAPDRVMTNAELEKIVDTSDEWIIERTGIRERRIAEPGLQTSALCEKAARKALDRAGVTPDELGLIILGTATPDFPFPSTAAIMQERLGTKGQMAFDITAACSGFLYSLIIADQFIRNGWCKYALVAGVELLSNIVNWEDRSTCVLFGDGAGAAVVGPSPDGERGIIATTANADGSTWPMLYLPAGGTRKPTTVDTVNNNLHKIHMEGNEVFKIAVRSLADAASTVLKKGGVKASDVDLFVPHQANLRIIDAVGKRLGVPEEKVFKNLERYGNTSAASIPLALDEAYESGAMKSGDLVLLDAFGAGATTAAALMRW